MITTQVFETLAGVHKRIAFERAHTTNYTFAAIRYYKDKRDPLVFATKRYPYYTWRIKKTRTPIRKDQSK